MSSTSDEKCKVILGQGGKRAGQQCGRYSCRIVSHVKQSKSEDYPAPETRFHRVRHPKPGHVNSDTDNTLALIWLTTNRKYINVDGVWQTRTPSDETEPPITIVFGEFKLKVDRYRARRVALARDALDTDTKLSELNISTNMGPLLTASGITLAFLFEYDWFGWMDDVKEDVEVLKGLLFTANYLNCSHLIRTVAGMLVRLIDLGGDSVQLHTNQDYFGETFPIALRQMVLTRSRTSQLFVKTPTGKTIALDVPAGASMLHIKEIIWEKEHYPPAQQRLILTLSGVQEDDRFIPSNEYRNSYGMFALVLKPQWSPWSLEQSSRGEYHQEDSKDLHL